MRKTFYAIVCALGFVGLPFAGQAFSTELVHDNFTDDEFYDTAVGMASNGDMTIVEVSEDDTTVSLWVYRHDAEQWYDEVTLTNTVVELADTMYVTHVDVAPAQQAWLVTWQVSYYDADDEYLSTLYHVAHVSRTATELDVTIPTMLSEAATSETGSTIEIIEAATGTGNPFVIWADGETINIAGFNGIERTFTEPRILNDVPDPTTYQAIALPDSLYIAWISAEPKMKLARFTNETGEALVSDFSRTASSDPRSNPLHVVLGADDEILILYQMGDELKRIVVNADGSLGDRDTVLSNIDYDLKSYNVGVMYNDYGKGQYDVVVFDGSKISLAHWRSHAKWTREDRFATGSRLNMYKFPNGHIQYVWSRSGKLYYKEYDPDTKQWTDTLQLGRTYGTLTLKSPLVLNQLQSSDATSSVHLFQRTHGSQQQLRLWKLGTALDQTVGKVWLPQQHQLIYQWRIDENYFLLFRKDNELRSAVLSEDSLF